MLIGGDALCVIRGRFLDAGTGTHSLKWINTLDTEGFTAVTADTLFADTTRKEVKHSFKTIGIIFC